MEQTFPQHVDLPLLPWVKVYRKEPSAFIYDEHSRECTMFHFGIYRHSWAYHGTVLFFASIDQGGVENVQYTTNHKTLRTVRFQRPLIDLKTMPGCRWKNSYERDREKKMNGPLLILAIFCRGGEGRQENLPKAAPGIAEMSSARSPITTKRKLRASCPALCMNHHEDTMTDLTILGSLPCEELQFFPRSKRREKAKFVLPRKSGKIS